MLKFLESAIIVCWIVFSGIWGIAALGAKRTAERRLGAWLGMLLPATLGTYLLLAGTSAPRQLGDRLLPHTVPVVAIGLVVLLAGIALALWARVVLGGNWSPEVTFKEDHELIRHGPYAYVRHPIYSATLLMLLGTAIAIGTLGALVSLPLILGGVWVKLGQEEILMSEHFPTEYAAYRSEVKALIPRLL